MNECGLKIGSLITTEQQRDAIHVAIAPVEAAEPLAPGQHVGFVQGGTELVGRSESPVGIIDPFLTCEVVSKGQKCWLFMYPNTITSLRHDWTHPSFAAASARDPEGESRRWIENFAELLGMTYGRLMEAAGLWAEAREWTSVGDNEAYRDHYDDFPAFWRHYERVTGKNIEDHESSFFSCSC